MSNSQVETLLEIWRDYRSQTENNLMYHRLPEPPAARDRLISEIRFFVDSIREKADNTGMYVIILETWKICTLCIMIMMIFEEHAYI